MSIRRLTICLFFRAPLGGLQENVLATAIAASNHGWEVSVLCPAGRFIEEHLRSHGIEALEVDFQSASSIQQAITWLTRADLICAHPGPSRNLALEAAEISGAPVVFTIHGAWFDGVQHYEKRLAAIVCVSSAVQEAVSLLCSDHRTICCIPNGIDTTYFDLPGHVMPDLGHIVIASRLDADKRVLIDTVIKLWQVQTKHADPQALRYTIAGQGTLLGELEAAAQKLNIAVEFRGWQTTDSLARLYAKASAVIASGRGAMESLAMGKPTLALASAGAIEVFDSSHFLGASRCNFGGYGAKPPTVIDDVYERLHDAATHANDSFVTKASTFIRTHHDNSVVNRLLLELYERVLLSKPL
jgi:glycosyltransferase involved in cell wall biosynthesis